MLLVKGNVGKSIIADAINKYNNAKIFVYDKQPIQTLDSYFLSVNECTLKEFCDEVIRILQDINDNCLPLEMIVIYTNLNEDEGINIIQKYAIQMEREHIVNYVVVMCKQ